jgi:hypothetical protein
LLFYTTEIPESQEPLEEQLKKALAYLDEIKQPVSTRSSRRTAPEGPERKKARYDEVQCTVRNARAQVEREKCAQAKVNRIRTLIENEKASHFLDHTYASRT